MESKFEQTKFITGLRAYSALAVFFIHSGGGGFRSLSSFASKLTDYGKYGVVSFFVISAFTICMSIDKDAKFQFGQYLKKRFLRIAPMYYIVLLLCFFLTDGVAYFNNIFHVGNSYYNLFLHITFLNLFDVRYINNIIGVEGTIPIEFFYYLLIPFVFFYLKANPKNSFDFLIFSFIFSLFSFKIFDAFYNPIDKIYSHHLSIEKYVFTFMIGIITYLIYKKHKIIRLNSWHLLQYVLLLLVIIYFDLPYPEYYISLWIGGLIIIGLSKNKLSKFLFENKLIAYLGKISYSIYLVHIPILSLLPKSLSLPFHLIIGLILTLLVSSVCYEFIEKPFIRLGKTATV